MVVYADILIFINTVINFLMLKITAVLCNYKYKFSRIVIGAFAGGLFSLYILIPQTNTFLEIAVKISVSSVMTVISFGEKKIKRIAKATVVLFAMSFLFAGIMIAIWYVFKPKAILINNGIVYLGISPIYLIIISVAAYFFVCLAMFILRKKIRGDRYCFGIITFLDKKVEVCALLDTGHSLKDSITGAPVIIVNKSCAENLFGNISLTAPTYSERYRVIPYKTINGSGIIPAYKCDLFTAIINGKEMSIKEIVVAVTKEEFDDNHNSIINPNIFSE